MQSRFKILTELAVQIQHEGNTEDTDLCHSILANVKTASEWMAMVNVKYHFYGPMSYQSHRFHYPKLWVKTFVAEVKSQ